MPVPNHLILFDGHCHLCDNSVKTILKFDHQKVFSFASLQSDIGKSLLIKYSIETVNGESIVYLKKNKALIKSGAALWIASKLKFPLNLLSGLIVIPPFIRDFVYDYVAKNRYQWFGKSESCLMSDENYRKRFLDL